MHLEPHEFWQSLHSPEEIGEGVTPGGTGYVAPLPDGRRVILPIRVLPGGGDKAVASLIVNQASFAVLDALADALAEALAPHDPEVIVAVPTLGLPLAEGVARRLGHARKVALGTSRKFWYDEALSEPLKSITTPDQAKRIYLDPRTLPLLRGRRIAVVDDVISTGSSMAAVLNLMGKAELAPVAIGAAMLQGTAWRDRLSRDIPICGVLSTPILARTEDGWAAAHTAGS